MPNVFVHTLLADRTLERWTAARSTPFDGGDPRCRAAFLHGALGPDLGYFPGSDVLLSEAAHRLRTSRMAQRLLATAHSDVEMAFACGWLTHLLLDVRVHPLVEIEARQIAREETGRTDVTHSPVHIAHIRVEVGLDGVFLDRLPGIGRRLPVVFDARGLSFLACAFRDVYGLDVSRDELFRAHQSVAHWHRCLVPLVRWMTADWSDEGKHAGRTVAPLLRANDGAWLRYVGVGPVAAAFVSPIRPSSRFVIAVEQEIDALGVHVDQTIRSPWLLPDLDMEDGAMILESMPKPATARTMAAIAARARSGAGRAPYSETARKPTTNAMVMSAISSMP